MEQAVELEWPSSPGLRGKSPAAQNDHRAKGCPGPTRCEATTPPTGGQAIWQNYLRGGLGADEQSSLHHLASKTSQGRRWQPSVGEEWQLL
eukprot:3894552-Pyramimonas_sp.AAC.1